MIEESYLGSDVPGFHAGFIMSIPPKYNSYEIAFKQEVEKGLQKEFTSVSCINNKKLPVKYTTG